MAIPIIEHWLSFYDDYHEGLGSSYERIILNDLLLSICEKFDVKKIMEVPSFGFTGISGINSMGLAKNGYEVTVVDNDLVRLEKIKKVWDEVNLKADFVFSEDFEKLDFCTDSYDLTWNFSALWYVDNLEEFYNEISRISKKVIIVCIPNKTGIGYITQYISKKSDQDIIRFDNINYKSLIVSLKKRGWTLHNKGFIDCPPWPDIGMTKENFLKKLGLSFLVKNQEKTKQNRISIIDYYKGMDKDFYSNMKKYEWFEKFLPNPLKLFWAHHRFFIFVKK